MSSEIEDIVADSIEELAVDDLIENREESEGNNRTPRWELFVAFTSSILAVLSALAALMATFASDKATVALSNEGSFSSSAEGLDASRTVLHAKFEILKAMNQSPSEDDLAELQHLDRKRSEMRARIASAGAVSDHQLKAHDRLAIAVTLFQVTMLLGGVAVMVKRRLVWFFGLGFSAVGCVFLLLGMMGYLY
ncbi:DUF4337 family protein [Chitinibacter sp. GC72]|uniref:DUF4337 family protein n=1 Tax=Chitinibacter sp. GC72 TaxID=1526917 RepID=UPI0012F75A17|nr:DUF4337 family protein [Chitinibacter sp. GC72]